MSVDTIIPISKENWSPFPIYAIMFDRFLGPLLTISVNRNSKYEFEKNLMILKGGNQKS